MIGLVIFYILSAVLCAATVAHNQTTKMYRNGERVYSRGGFILRMAASVIPAVNTWMFIFAAVEPFGAWDAWLDSATGEPCRRDKFKAWFDTHPRYDSK